MKVGAVPRATLVSAMIVGIGVSSAVLATDDTAPEDDLYFAPETIAFTPATIAFTPDTIAPTLDSIAVGGTIGILGFCDELVEFEKALLSEDPVLIEAAGGDLIASAPDEMTAAAVEDVLANVEAGPFDPAYIEAHTALIDQIRADCGYEEYHVIVDDHTFEGIPADLAAVETNFTLENVGDEVHEIYIGRIHDDVDIPIEEILAMPEEERSEYMDDVAYTMAYPGEPAETGPVPLEPGRHVAVCFVAEGTFPGSADESLEPGMLIAGDGPPHWELGMYQEFEAV